VRKWLQAIDFVWTSNERSIHRTVFCAGELRKPSVMGHPCGLCLKSPAGTDLDCPISAAARPELKVSISRIA
jgi:hypothetical protein